MSTFYPSKIKANRIGIHIRTKLNVDRLKKVFSQSARAPSVFGKCKVANEVRKCHVVVI